MSSKVILPPPALSINNISAHIRSSSSAPAFGIPTYSHRVLRIRSRTAPNPRTQSMEVNVSLNDGTSEDSEEGGQLDLKQVTMAQIHGHVSARRAIPDFRDDSPSRSEIEDPVVYRKVPPTSEGGGGRETRSIRPSHKTASIYPSLSTSSAESTNIPSLPYLVASTLSLSHLGVSQESLAANETGRPVLIPSSCDTSSSRTVQPKLRNHLHDIPPFHRTSVVPFHRAQNHNLSIDSSSAPSLSSLLSHPQPLSRPRPRPDETPAAERLKRLYLCPWESKEPGICDSKPPFHTVVDLQMEQKESNGARPGGRAEKKRSLRERFSTSHRVSGRRRAQGEMEINEKSYGGSTVVEVGQDLADLIKGGQKHKGGRTVDWVYLLKLGFLTLFSLAFMIDLVILNVRVLVTEDWE
ncbi:uncharacterized protein JCM6883_004043 [Sporobolomyces salmoneus]|uniref:uncharacterized protein n=1 Tax=Sporobolomyces salmoneus TaxID=183962 RepID=UPI00317CFB7F